MNKHFDKIENNLKENMQKVINHFNNMQKTVSKDIKTEDLEKFHYTTSEVQFKKLNRTEQYYYLLGLRIGVQMCTEISEKIEKLIISSFKKIRGLE